MTILFAWDFHGVLEEGNEHAVLEVTNQSLREHGYEDQATFEDIKRLYGLPWGDYFRQLVPNVTEDEVEKMVNRSRELGRPAAERFCKPRNNVHSILKRIQAEGHTSIVVSNSTQDDIEFFMKIIGVTHYIQESYGVKGKKDETIRSHAESGDYSKIVVIGDTERDIEAGLAVNATTYLVLNGEPWRSKAHHIITDIREILRELG